MDEGELALGLEADGGAVEDFGNDRRGEMVIEMVQTEKGTGITAGIHASGGVTARECFDGTERFVDGLMVECGIPVAILLVVESDSRFGCGRKGLKGCFRGEGRTAAVLKGGPEGDVAQAKLGGARPVRRFGVFPDTKQEEERNDGPVSGCLKDKRGCPAFHFKNIVENREGESNL